MAPSGQSELVSRELTLEAMTGMLGELLPPETRQALDELGAVQHDLPPSEGFEDGFTVVTARGDDDIWIEIRRHRKSVEAEVEAGAPEEIGEIHEIDLDAVTIRVEPEPAPEPIRPTPHIRGQPPAVPEPQSAVVLPFARSSVLSEQPLRFTQPLHSAGIDRLLRIAAARGASTLYLTSQARPSIRVDGEIGVIEASRF